MMAIDFLSFRRSPTTLTGVFAKWFLLNKQQMKMVRLGPSASLFNKKKHLFIQNCTMSSLPVMKRWTEEQRYTVCVCLPLTLHVIIAQSS